VEAPVVALVSRYALAISPRPPVSGVAVVVAVASGAAKHPVTVTFSPAIVPPVVVSGGCAAALTIKLATSANAAAPVL
jgi:hypothetical protein